MRIWRAFTLEQLWLVGRNIEHRACFALAFVSLLPRNAKEETRLIRSACQKF